MFSVAFLTHLSVPGFDLKLSRKLQFSSTPRFWEHLMNPDSYLAVFGIYLLHFYCSIYYLVYSYSGKYNFSSHF